MRLPGSRAGWGVGVRVGPGNGSGGARRDRSGGFLAPAALACGVRFAGRQRRAPQCLVQRDERDVACLFGLGNFQACLHQRRARGSAIEAVGKTEPAKRCGRRVPALEAGKTAPKPAPAPAPAADRRIKGLQSAVTMVPALDQLGLQMLAEHLAAQPFVRARGGRELGGDYAEALSSWTGGLSLARKLRFAMFCAATVAERTVDKTRTRMVARRRIYGPSGS